MKIIFSFALILSIIGCSSLPRLSKTEFNGSNLSFHIDYNIEQMEYISGDVFKITSPPIERILFNIYNENGILIGTLYNGQGGSFLIDLDSLSDKYDFKLLPGNYLMVLYGEKGKADFNFKVTSINSYLYYNNIPGKEEIRYYTKMNNKTGKIESLPIPFGGILGIQSKVIYPIEAKRNGIEGKVVMNCWVDTLGIVNKVEIVKGLGYGIDEAAIRAAKLTRFLPARIDGIAVSFIVSIPIIFSLQ